MIKPARYAPQSQEGRPGDRRGRGRIARDEHDDPEPVGEAIRLSRAGASLGGQPLYPDVMMALRDALSRELSIASAITEARRVRPVRPHTLGPTVNCGHF